MASPPKAIRILIWFVAIAGLLGVFALFLAKQSTVPLVNETLACNPLPPSIKRLGAALPPQDAASAMEAHGQDWGALKATMRDGDTVREFETAVSGGHLVMRGDCFLGQAVTWVR